jgi:hypothetical protein
MMERTSLFFWVVSGHYGKWKLKIQYPREKKGWKRMKKEEKFL